MQMVKSENVLDKSYSVPVCFALDNVIVRIARSCRFVSALKGKSENRDRSPSEDSSTMLCYAPIVFHLSALMYHYVKARISATDTK